ncbi:hypothetical protein SHKM778_19410 [Streptomyces sp. KM77-8]|uniref:Ketoreductase domain-containing protein n=1 Tax=Streptomyces haneummycinicus TaxID=3074435 RepID=A0AAT9HDN9_9ACTN
MWGGSDTGLMKVVADGVEEAGGRLCGVSVEFLAAKARDGVDEMVIARDLAERKRLLLEKADSVVIMVGGTGTLDEATEILELKKHGHTEMPVVLLNTAGFYDGLKEQFRRMEDEGFLPRPSASWCSSPRSRWARWPTWRRSWAWSERPVMRAWRAWLHVITGAGSGIGAAVARRLHARGDELVLHARDAGRAKELVAEFPGARTLVGDLADPDKLSWAFSHQSLPDRVDSVLHIAGVVDLGPVGDLTPKTWRHQLNVNLIAPAELTRHLLPQLRLSRGHVIFVNSGAGLSAHAGWSAYAASKHGLKALADSLREEEHAAGVRVTSVYPGRTASPMQAKVHRQEGKDYDPSRWIDPESVATTIVTALDLPRDAEINDVTVRPGR